jgi:hypothetical protein
MLRQVVHRVTTVLSGASVKQPSSTTINVMTYQMPQTFQQYICDPHGLFIQVTERQKFTCKSQQDGKFIAETC